jgi:hypothetical protein
MSDPPGDAPNGKSNEPRREPSVQMPFARIALRKRNKRRPTIPFWPNIYWPVIPGRVHKSEPSVHQRVLFAFAFIALASTASEARPLRTAGQASECNISMPCDFSFSQTRRVPFNAYGQRSQRVERRAIVQRDSSYRLQLAESGSAAIGGRPAGCPHSFCGCGASIRVFGRIVPELNLAANWLKFPRTSPAPGMVAARHGHVFVLESHIEGDTWMAYDANSGGHATRIHARSLRGYAIVNPHA